MAITAAQLQVLIGADTSGAEKGMNAVSRSLQSFGADAMKVGGVLSAAVTAPLMILGKQAVDAATNLDREMRNIQSISKQTDAEIAALSDTFVRMSMDAGVTTDSAVKLAAAYYDIQGSGFAGAEAMKVLEASTKAASAGLTDTDVAAKAITATLNAYGYGADEATRVSDVLFKTMDIGVVSFEELAQNLGDIVGTAAIAGVSIEELGAGYATMTKAGIGAAESSTALNQLMLSFISPSKQAAEMAATLGIDLSAAALQSKGLGGAMADLTEKVGLHKIVMTGADEATKAQIKSIDQQVRALQAQKDALGPATKANKEQRDAIQAQIKALQSQKKELRDSIDTNVDYNLVLTTMAERAGVTVEQMAALFPNVRALKAALSLTREEMGPFAEDLEAIGGAAGATEAAFAIQAKSFAAQMKTFNNTLEGLKISIGNIVLPVLTELMNRVRPLLDRLMNLDDGTKRLIVTIGAVAAAAGPVLMVIGSMSMVLGALLSPVGLVVAAVAALGLAFATNFGGIRTAVMPVLDEILKAIQPLVDILTGPADWGQKFTLLAEAAPGVLATLGELLGELATKLLNWVGESLPGWMEELGKLALAATAWVLDAIPGLLANLTLLAEQLLTAISGLLPTVLQATLGLGQALIGWVVEALPGLLANLATLAEQLLTAISGLLPTVLQATLGLGQALIGWVVEALPGLLANLATLAEQLLTAISGLLPTVLQATLGLGQALIGWVVEALPGLLANLATLAQALIGALMAHLPGWIGALVQFGVEAVSWVVGQIPALLDALREFFSTMVNWVVESLPGWVTELQKLAQAAVQWVVDALPGLGTNLGLIVGKLLMWVKEIQTEVLPKLGLVLLELAGKFLEWIWTTVLPQLPKWLGEILVTILNFIGGMLTAIDPEVGKVAQGIIDGLTKGIRGAAQWLSDALKWLVVDHIIAPIKRWLGIASPSTVMFEMGRNVVFGIIDGVRGMASALWEVWSGLWAGVIDRTKESINSVIGLVNRLISAWNGLEFRIPGFGVDLPQVDIPGVGTIGGGRLGWGGVTIGTPDLPTIPRLAEGGIVTKPTLALIGERGPEAVVPLRQGQQAPADRDLAALVRALQAQVEAMADLIETLGGQTDADTMLRRMELKARLGGA